MAYTLVPTELIVDGAITSAKLDTNLAISGTLGVTGEVTLATHLNMGDNDKIKIGTGGDLEIYHDGSNSYISNSTGNIYLGDTNGAVHIQAKLNEESIVCAADGAVTLYHDNAVKLATTSSGVDVTGTVVADGVEVDGLLHIDGSDNSNVASFALTRTDASWSIDNETNLRIYGNTGDTTNPATKRFEIGTGGDISFYEDTGTTAKFFWDASAERLGIGTTSPARLLEVSGNGGKSRFTRSGSAGTTMEFYSGGSQAGGIQVQSTGLGISGGAGENHVFIDSSGNVGIGMTPTTNNISKSISLVNGGSIFGYGNGTYITANSNYNGAWNTVATGVDSRMLLDGNVIFYRSASASAGSAGAVTESMRIDSSGNVGIGETSPSNLLHVKASDAGIAPHPSAQIVLERDGTNYLQFLTTAAGTSGLLFGDTNDIDVSKIYVDHNTTKMTFVNEASETMTLNGPNVGIGTASPLSKLQIMGGTSGVDQISLSSNLSDNTVKYAGLVMTMYTNNTAALIGAKAENGNTSLFYGSSGSDHRGVTKHIWYTNSNYNSTSGNTERMKIDSTGLVSINPINNSYNFKVFATDTDSFFGVREDANNSVILQVDRSDGYTGFLYNGHSMALSIGGALSKASGSFKIDHPLESKKDTHHLVHSFVEAPQADNIYRGVVTLVNGSATINLDTEAGMTEGTYVVLNTNTSCFTSNESDWDAVKGSVSGNILTISCQNSSSTATVSWLVIGERHDQHMKDTDWTDENGKVIVEPTK